MLVADRLTQNRSSRSTCAGCTTSSIRPTARPATRSPRVEDAKVHGGRRRLDSADVGAAASRRCAGRAAAAGRLAGRSFQPAPDRAHAHHRLSKDGGDEVHRRPHRLGQSALPPQHRGDQSGRAALSPGRRAPRDGGPSLTAPAAEPKPQSFRELAAGGLDAFGNAMVAVENLLPPLTSGDGSVSPPISFGVNKVLSSHPGQRQAPRYRDAFQSAVQDSPLHEHRRRDAPAALFEPPDESGPPGARGGRGRQSGGRPRRHLERYLPIASASSSPRRWSCAATSSRSGRSSWRAVLEKRDAEALAEFRDARESPC